MRVAVLLAAGLLAGLAAAPGRGARPPCRSFAGTGDATQLVTVRGGAQRTTAALELWRRTGSCWRRVAGPWRARVGRTGISARKREGDGATPAGTYRLGATAYGLDPDPGFRGRYHRLVCGDWWDEDPGSATYNRFRHVGCGASPPFGGGSEALWRATTAYRELLVVEYNAHPAVPGRGSAIFLHDDTGGPTNGCVSLPRPELLRLLRRLRPADRPRIRIAAGA
jgi:L,D-peptidoglycan transpeptidase YkuD (ErfK/YbiS/YcfS/YnhG family)